MKKNKAALYLRSSKDRHDVSIEMQRKELHELAEAKNLIITTEFKDVVESAKSEFREGFQTLLHEMKSSTRQWDYLLLTDTSRLSRRRYVSHAFKHEAEKRGVTILYSKVPEVDPISQVVLESVFEAMDEVHSLMSKEKGIGGMITNVKNGYRAGGRAPRGYKLKKIATGAMRDGEAVTKSVLEKNEDATLVKRYLECRLEGMSRAETKRYLKIKWADTSLIGMEWNALTYAGHTVWNVHNEKSPEGGYVGGNKRRPREEWHIKENTHPALITSEEAEILLTRLETSEHGKLISMAKSGVSSYLLTGLLKTPEGENFIGNGKKYYRLKKGKWFRTKHIDAAVTNQLEIDLNSDAFIDNLVKEAHKMATNTDDPVKKLKKDLIAINTKISRASDQALMLNDPSPMLRKIDELESARHQITKEIATIEEEHNLQATLKNITPDQVKKIIGDFNLSSADNRKKLIRSLVERITLDPANNECQIHYKIPCSLSMASPRGFEGYTALKAITNAIIKTA